jgi:hypothetical protein
MHRDMRKGCRWHLARTWGHTNEVWEHEVDDLQVDIEDLVKERKGERICEQREMHKRGQRS